MLDFIPAEPEWDDVRHPLSRLKNTTYSGKLVLLHGDFWPENLLWQDNEVVAILDWQDAAIGDPLSDIACTCLELRYRFGTHGMNLFKLAYHEHAKIDLYRFALWQAYVSTATQHLMGEWGLEPDRESRMRSIALTSLQEAVHAIMA
ncbi:MAG: aminoglycoside phosphotransferase family protein [Pseudomonadota bacterium]